MKMDILIKEIPFLDFYVYNILKYPYTLIMAY